ncbi:hypothetical protein B4915_06720 [Leucobacter massiliensis]|uniref:Uncharacterized protein n=2 Tax=Leucobacter massiliensis TaxID=1686285 RepID=A0A2S9QPK1_9MICO|nr:hypothetical protein B4915_06720 [Leucobacter massiliensis]
MVTATIAAIEAAAAALAGVLLVAIPALLVWVVAFQLAAEPASVFAAVTGIWLLAHWVPLGFALTPEAALALGQLPEELRFTLSLAPLGITLVTLLLAARAGWRFGGRGGVGAAGVLGGAAGFGAVALLLALFSAPETPWPLGAVAAVPALSYGAASALAFVLRAARDEHPWWRASVRETLHALEALGVRGAAAMPSRAGQMLRLAAALLAIAVGASALALTVAIVVGYPRVIALGQGLQLDPLGSLVLFLGQLALLPDALVWALAWLTGAGFSLGAGTSVTPFETLLGPVPSLPLFGAIPSGWGALGALAPGLLVLGGLAVGLLFARRPEIRRAPWGVTVVSALLAGALAGLAVAGLAALARGSIGPGRLAEAGADPWTAGGLAAAELGTGLLLGLVAGKADAARLRGTLPAMAAAAGALRRRRAEDRDAGAVPASETREAARDAGTPEAGREDDQETAPLGDALSRLRVPGWAGGGTGGEAPSADPDPAPDPDPEPAPDPAPDPEPTPDPGPQAGAEHETEPESEPRAAGGNDSPETGALDAEALLRAYSWDAAGPVTIDREGESLGAAGDGGEDGPVDAKRSRLAARWRRRQEPRG